MPGADGRVAHGARSSGPRRAGAGASREPGDNAAVRVQVDTYDGCMRRRGPCRERGRAAPTGTLSRAWPSVRADTPDQSARSSSMSSAVTVGTA